ncbi:MAG: hypothetical protein C0505_05095 [Leptothrix sp. (in: Bacteria)]|nr:hypothetical protein [Leptothrix sp. (in: b-proteobacteria)]
MLIRIAPGRALRWAPRWDCSDTAVLFDATSGDYWVLDPEARQVVEWLQADASIERHALLQRLAAQESDGAALLDGLAQAGLLTGVVDGRGVPLPRRADADD